MITDEIKIVIVSSDKEYAQAMDVRRKVFCEEYQISPNKEFDGNDFGATHILAYYNNMPIGTMRIRYFNGFVKMERMCVLSEFRKTPASEQIMQKGMIFAAQKGYEKVYGVCKKELLSRWQKNGFEPIPDAPHTEQNGMTLVPIYCKLPQVNNKITFQTDAQTLNAKEGEWFDNCQQGENILNESITEKELQTDAVKRIKNLTNRVKFIKSAAFKEEVVFRVPFKYPQLNQTDDKTH